MSDTCLQCPDNDKCAEETSRRYENRKLEESQREALEYLVNLDSWFTMKPEVPRKEDLCVNYKKHCKKCQEPQCDSARGGVKDVSKHEWKVIKSSELNELLENAKDTRPYKEFVEELGLRDEKDEA